MKKGKRKEWERGEMRKRGEKRGKKSIRGRIMGGKYNFGKWWENFIFWENIYPWIIYPCILKVIVTLISSECLQIGFGVLIIDYICNFLI